MSKDIMNYGTDFEDDIKGDFPVSGPPAWRPSHPGELLREDVLPALGLSVSAAAEHLHVSRQMLHRILSEESAVSPEMAVRLGKLCGDGPRIWLAMQQAHDLWQAERDLAAEVQTIQTLVAA
jgi:addiction module HigA family antidote